MAKIKYSGEFEINASPRMIYPYLSTPSGLKDWFADEVNLDADKAFLFYWDGVSSKAVKVTQKINQHVRFDFVDPKASDRKDVAYLDLKLDVNDLTQTSFLKVIDYSEVDHVRDLEELWDNLIGNLRDAVGA